MILTVEDDSRWGEVVGGCNPCRRLVGKHHKRVGLLLFWVTCGVERRRREEKRENDLNLLGAKESLCKINTWLKIKLLYTKYK